MLIAFWGLFTVKPIQTIYVLVPERMRFKKIQYICTHTHKTMNIYILFFCWSYLIHSNTRGKTENNRKDMMWAGLIWAPKLNVLKHAKVENLKNENSAIIYSPSCHFQSCTVCISFSCRTHTKIFWIMFQLFLSTCTYCKGRMKQRKWHLW